MSTNLPAHLTGVPVPRPNHGAFGRIPPAGSSYATYGPPSRMRFGTARRDLYGNLLPGEYDQYGRPIPQGPPGLTPMAQWQAMFPGDGTTTAGPTSPQAWNEAFHPDRLAQQGPTASGQTMDAVRANDAAAQGNIAAGNRAVQANTAAAQGNIPVGNQAQRANTIAGLLAAASAAPAVGADIAAAQGNIAAGAQSVAANDVAARNAGAQIGDVRRTPWGSVQTLMPSQSGSRWVGSTSGAPPMTNFRPGDAGTNSLADQANYAGANVPVPTINADGTKSNIPSAAQNAALYAPGGMRGPMTSYSRFGNGSGGPPSNLNSEGIQRQLDDAVGVPASMIADPASYAQRIPRGIILPNGDTMSVDFGSSAVPGTVSDLKALTRPFGTINGGVTNGGSNRLTADAGGMSGRNAFGDAVSPLKNATPTTDASAENGSSPTEDSGGAGGSDDQYA